MAAAAASSRCFFHQGGSDAAPTGGSNMTEYETLKRLVTEAEEDVAKAIGGNKAAGTRVRKKMQEIKSAAQDVRKKILEGREGEAGGGGAAEGGTGGDADAGGDDE